MPQPVLTKYKQGDLGADYPTKPNNQVQSSFWKKASEKDY